MPLTILTVNHFVFLMGILISINACSITRNTNLPILTINDKLSNGKIINRRPPEYSEGTNAGCIVLSEIQLDLMLFKKSLSAGVVSDVATK
jgi:hypothetical protein